VVPGAVVPAVPEAVTPPADKPKSDAPKSEAKPKADEKAKSEDKPKAEEKSKASAPADTNVVRASGVTTELVLHVPADARVFLAGQPTVSVGPQRSFTTNRLASGRILAGYPVRVEFVHNGRTVVREQQLDLRGGERRELTVTVEGTGIAQSGPAATR